MKTKTYPTSKLEYTECNSSVGLGEVFLYLELKKKISGIKKLFLGSAVINYFRKCSSSRVSCVSCVVCVHRQECVFGELRAETFPDDFLFPQCGVALMPWGSCSWRASAHPAV